MKPVSDTSPAAAVESYADAAVHLHTLLDIVRFAATRFGAAGLVFGHGTENAIDEALALVLYALDLPNDTPESLLGARLTAAEKRRIMQLVERRIEERVPLAYLTRRAWFAGLEFYVDERVLVPRSPMAELIEQGMAPWIEQPEQVESVLDMCAGSGCIGIASAFAFPHASVDLVDVSVPALQVAAINVQRFGLGERVAVIASDMFASLKGRRYDLILCNPPYVAREEFAALPAEYAHEPDNGLLAGDDGLDAVRVLLGQAHEYLTDDGVLVVEVGDTAHAVSAAWPQIPFTWLGFEHGGSGVFLLSAEQARMISLDPLIAPGGRAREG